MKRYFVLNSAQMRHLDALAIQDFGISGIVLMENAGRAVVQCIHQQFALKASDIILVFAGMGNNGGDGFVVARHLWNEHCCVEVILLGRIDLLSGDCKQNAEIARKLGIPIFEAKQESELAVVAEHLRKANYIIDAIFGTGLTRPASGMFAEVIDMINELSTPVIAVDIPSGLSSDLTYAFGPTIQADLTIALAHAKRASIFYPAAKHNGLVKIVDISIPHVSTDMLHEFGSILHPLDFESIFRLREADSHKGSFGHLLIIAGSPGKTGAACLAGAASLATGVGLSTIAIPENLNSIVEVKLTEVMSAPIPSNDGNHLDDISIKPLQDQIQGKSAIVIGPGLGSSSGTKKTVQQILLEAPIPIVADADAINLMSSDFPIFSDKIPPRILTPHPGEMSRLLNKSTSEILMNQIELLTEFAQRHHVYLVLKTARTLVAKPDGKWYVNVTGNPGMASGGTGDVLSGLIGGFLAQAISTHEAIFAGVFLHGLSGDYSAKCKGEISMTATDIIENFPIAYETARRNLDVCIDSFPLKWAHWGDDL